MCVLSHSVVSDSLELMDCSPPGSSVHEILQVRTLERVAISFPRGRISYIGKWTLYPITTWEALYKDISKLD